MPDLSDPLAATLAAYSARVGDPCAQGLHYPKRRPLRLTVQQAAETVLASAGFRPGLASPRPLYRAADHPALADLPPQENEDE